MNFIYVFVIAIASAIVQSVTGFGYTVVSMTTLPFFLSPISATTISGLIGNIQSTYLTIKNRKHINFKVMILPLVVSVIFSTAAIYFIANQPPGLYKKVLGAFLCILAVYMIFFNHKVHIKANTTTGIITGAVSGLANGLFGMGGPFTVMYVLAATKDKDEYLSTIQCLFLLSGIFTTLARIANGALTNEVLKYSAVSVVGMFVGLVIGIKIFKKLSQKQVSKFVYGFMFVMGIIIVFS